MFPLPYPRLSVRLDANGKYVTGGTQPSFKADGAVDPESQKYSVGHGICAVRFGQKNPTIHRDWIELLWGQYEPITHFCTVDGVLQKLPAGHGLSWIEPAWQ